MTDKKAVVSFRVSPDELDAIEDSARAAHESVSGYVRRAVQSRHALRYPTSLRVMTSGADFTFFHSPEMAFNLQTMEAPNTANFERNVEVLS